MVGKQFMHHSQGRQSFCPATTLETHFVDRTQLSPRVGHLTRPLDTLPPFQYGENRRIFTRQVVLDDLVSCHLAGLSKSFIGYTPRVAL